jgi:hypothetical protein
MGGAELTFGEENRYASIQLRTVRCVETGQEFNGPQRVFREIFEDGGSVLEPSPQASIQRMEKPRITTILAAPRVGLNLTEFSDQMDDRIDYILRPYRFINTEIKDFADKYVAYLYMYKIAGLSIDVSSGQTIFKKYLHAFEVGREGKSLDVIWEERSKPLRLARLLGYKSRQVALIEPSLPTSDLNVVI